MTASADDDYLVYIVEGKVVVLQKSSNWGEMASNPAWQVSGAATWGVCLCILMMTAVGRPGAYPVQIS